MKRWAGLTALFALALASPASAYRTAANLPEIRSSKPVAWASTVELDIYRGGATSADVANLRDAVSAAFAPWERIACGTFGFSLAGYADAAPQAGDGRNTLSRIESGWESLGFPAGAAAYTDVSYTKVGDHWLISEADVYLNAQDFEWIPFGMTSDPNQRSLQAILTHELGHVLGLLHPCELQGGSGIPACTSDPGFQATMMYPVYDATKLDLSPDDVSGVCSIYGCSPDCADADAGAPSAMDAAPGCATDTDCPTNQRCLFGQCVAADEPGSSSCYPTGPAACTPFGEACDNAADCVGAVCLKGAERGPVCSQSCTTRSCPLDWTCLEVSHERVCAPPDYQAQGGGCAVRGALPTSDDSSAGLGLLLFAVAAVRRRRKGI